MTDLEEITKFVKPSVTIGLFINRYIIFNNTIINI